MKECKADQGAISGLQARIERLAKLAAPVPGPDLLMQLGAAQRAVTVAEEQVKATTEKGH